MTLEQIQDAKETIAIYERNISVLEKCDFAEWDRLKSLLAKEVQS